MDKLLNDIEQSLKFINSIVKLNDFPFIINSYWQSSKFAKYPDFCECILKTPDFLIKMIN